MIGNSDDETNLAHKVLLTNRQVANFCKAFANNSSVNIKLSKIQLSKMIQSGVFRGRFLGPLLKTGIALMKNVINLLATSVLIPLGLTAEASATDAGMHKKNLESRSITLMISNNEMEDIMNIHKSPEDSSLLSNRVSETIQNDEKEEK